MAKIFYYDIETTGLDHKKAAMHQLSGAIEINGQVVEEFNFKIAPLDHGIESVLVDKSFKLIPYDKEHSQAALDMAGATLEELKEVGIDPLSAMNKVISMMEKYVNQYDKKDKFFLCGYNNRRFDDNIFRQWFTDLGYKWFGSWFWNDTLDVLVLAAYTLMEERSELDNFKLATVARHLDIEVDEARLHDALYDIELTRQMFHVIKEINETTSEER